VNPRTERFLRQGQVMQSLLTSLTASVNQVRRRLPTMIRWVCPARAFWYSGARLRFANNHGKEFFEPPNREFSILALDAVMTAGHK
jgi:hypothetical protein